MVQVWIDLHRDELLADWELASAGEELFRIDPLKQLSLSASTSSFLTGSLKIYRKNIFSVPPACLSFKPD